MNVPEKVRRAFDQVIFEHQRECYQPSMQNPGVLFNDVPYYISNVRDEFLDIIEYQLPKRRPKRSAKLGSS